MGLGGAGGGGAGGVGISASPAADVSVERQETRAQARAPAGRVCRPTLLAGRTRQWAHRCRGVAYARKHVGADAGEGRGEEGEGGGQDFGLGVMLLSRQVPVHWQPVGQSPLLTKWLPLM